MPARVPITTELYVVQSVWLIDNSTVVTNNDNIQCTVESHRHRVYLIYGMDYGMDRWNGLMEWTDGMEYQLTKIAKTHIMAVAKLHISVASPLLTSTGLLCLASVF